MRRYAVAALGALVLATGCLSPRPPSFDVSPLLRQDEGKLLRRESLRFGKMWGERGYYRSAKGYIVVHEDLRTSYAYGFEANPGRLAHLLFDRSESVPLGRRGRYAFYRIDTPRGTLNLMMVQSADNRRLRLMYGVDDATFERMMTSVGLSAPKGKAAATVYREISALPVVPWSVHRLLTERIVVRNRGFSPIR